MTGPLTKTTPFLSHHHPSSPRAPTTSLLSHQTPTASPAPRTASIARGKAWLIPRSSAVSRHAPPWPAPPKPPTRSSPLSTPPTAPPVPFHLLQPLALAYHGFADTPPQRGENPKPRSVRAGEKEKNVDFPRRSLMVTMTMTMTMTTRISKLAAAARRIPVLYFLDCLLGRRSCRVGLGGDDDGGGGGGEKRPQDLLGEIRAQSRQRQRPAVLPLLVRAREGLAHLPPS